MAPVFENMTPLAKEVALPRLKHALMLQHQRRQEVYFGLLASVLPQVPAESETRNQVIYT